jgi:hypothetical protein
MLIDLLTVIQAGFVCNIIKGPVLLLGGLEVVRSNLIDLVERIIFIFSILFLPF